MPQIAGCGVIQYVPVLIKPRPMAGAVPRVFCPIPVQRAAQMGAPWAGGAKEVEDSLPTVAQQLLMQHTAGWGE